MPVSFRDGRTESTQDIVGYLRFVDEDGGRGIRGALFLVNARGEPAEFVYSRVDLPARFLWRPDEPKRHAVASLAAVLFQACQQMPSLIMVLDNEVHPGVFSEDLKVGIPICRAADGIDAPHLVAGSFETIEDTVHLFWVGDPPASNSAARNVLDAMSDRQLVLEPFERAASGLDEVFREEQ